MQEIWRDIYYTDTNGDVVDFRGHYQISNYGRVKSLKYNRELILQEKYHYRHKSTTIYNCKVNLCKNGKKTTYLIARLVGFMFIVNDDPINKCQINHIDENPANNHVSNLEWCTPEYNLRYGTRDSRSAESKKGFKHTEESKQAISLSMQSENNPFFGKNHSEESKQKQMIDKGTKIIAINIANSNDILYFDSIRDADRKGFNRSCIMQCISPNGNQNTHKGYKWYKIDLFEL